MDVTWNSMMGLQYLHFEIVQLLIEKGVDINWKSYENNTALHTAVGTFNIKIIKYLIDNGANINAQNESGDTPLHIALKRARIIDPLDITTLFIQKEANINIKNKKEYTPLHFAIVNNWFETVELLLIHNAIFTNDDILEAQQFDDIYTLLISFNIKQFNVNEDINSYKLDNTLVIDPINNNNSERDNV